MPRTSAARGAAHRALDAPARPPTSWGASPPPWRRGAARGAGSWPVRRSSPSPPSSPAGEAHTGAAPATLRRGPGLGARALLREGGDGRLGHLAELRGIFERQDDSAPTLALRDAVGFAALARNVDYLSDHDNRVPVITIHQAKGLEFDVVFVAGAVDDEFPSWFSKRDGGERLAEEQRLFYVAVTRARRCSSSRPTPSATVATAASAPPTSTRWRRATS